jgi:hypothetical protein
MNALTRLANLAGPPISASTPRLTSECSTLAGGDGHDLLMLLQKRNGFYAFESALHVFPAVPEPEHGSIEWWNSDSLWRSSYGSLANDALFFAEDIFGSQFCLFQNRVFRFDPETGSRSGSGSSIEEWADLLLQASENETGWPLAHEWQNKFGPIAAGNRLVPKKPFVLGGEFSLENLHSVESVRAMNFYANLASQIASLPDGSSVSLKVID